MIVSNTLNVKEILKIYWYIQISKMSDAFITVPWFIMLWVWLYQSILITDQKIYQYH
jgi:hypothetical protein